MDSPLGYLKNLQYYSLRRKDSAFWICSADGESSTKSSILERNLISFLNILNGMEINGQELLIRN